MILPPHIVTPTIPSVNVSILSFSVLADQIPILPHQSPISPPIHSYSSSLLSTSNLSPTTTQSPTCALFQFLVTCPL
jgi:hypothetical protein